MNGFETKFIQYRVSQRKVPTFENSKHQEFFMDLNDSNFSQSQKIEVLL